MDSFNEKLPTDGSPINLEKAKQAATDALSNGKLKEILTKVREPGNHVIEDTMELLNGNEKLRRDAMNLAQNQDIQDQVNNSTNAEKKKMVALKAAAGTAALRRGEIQGVCINLKGNASSISYREDQLMQDPKYTKLLFKSPHDETLLIFCNSTLISGKNRLISEFLAMTIFGPVVIFSYDEETGKLVTITVKMVEMILKTFKATGGAARLIKKLEMSRVDQKVEKSSEKI
ncbi:Hypothetical protein POVR1_LOCUS50 [uncultured virus]|nr:Hypothetical protein POVR1_LOCUS50 [uncultured virus]